MSQKLTRKDWFVSFVVSGMIKKLANYCLLVVKELPEDKRKNLPPEKLLKHGLLVLNEYLPSGFVVGGKIQRGTLDKLIKEREKQSFEFTSYVFNMMKCSWNLELHEKIKERDEDYFIENFDFLTKDLPIGEFGEMFQQFKHFISIKNAVPERHMNVIWSMFDNIGNWILYPDESIDKNYSEDKLFLTQ